MTARGMARVPDPQHEALRRMVAEAEMEISASVAAMVGERVAEAVRAVDGALAAARRGNASRPVFDGLLDARLALRGMGVSP